MARKKNSLTYEVLKGIWDENPVMVSLLGLCPTLAVTNSALNGLTMSMATGFVLLCSSLMISLLRNLIPPQVRIASYIVIIATFVTVVDRYLAAFDPAQSKALGPYIPLIVVNCVILGRQEAFSAKNNPGRSLLDSFGMTLGFTAVLVILGGIRELLGAGSIFNIQIMGDWFNPWMVMILPPGAFFTLGILIALVNLINERRAQR
ncbi:MAG: electron transport complex subunit E [Deltaproteobacteria bacterium]|jgi:Na+-translocating ferredoxin:NAD+ oxidoreductase subunit E|nr:electron transport complex subunit E [Deltaproteobacteria bacterium]MBT4639192.1 electron transport complex subunit E [Deltaproteobacteria bacterium]MBT6498671.1 electron transport complex subunit E [Deltaproteobacteria bacterium]MBT6616418.1 electron transport complex subunit E [Deltaproteobacteria bacterium]MBT7153333.1 electron transport complex subunit E [Deltaproteobacteria bacterium]